MTGKPPDPQALRERAAGVGGSVRDIDATSFAVSGLDGTMTGALALSAGVALDELAPVRRSLEDAFMELTAPSGREPATPSPPLPRFRRENSLVSPCSRA